MSSMATPRKRRPPAPKQPVRLALAAALMALPLLLLYRLHGRGSSSSAMPLPQAAIEGLPGVLDQRLQPALVSANATGVTADPTTATSLRILMLGHELTLTGAPLALLEVSRNDWNPLESFHA